MTVVAGKLGRNEVNNRLYTGNINERSDKQKMSEHIITKYKDRGWEEEKGEEEGWVGRERKRHKKEKI